MRGHGYQTFSMQAELYERYLVRMLIDIKLNEDRTQLLGHANPRWVVYEIKAINKLPGGTFQITPRSESERKLTPEQWQKVVAAGGDLSVLGLSLAKDKPVLWFREYWRSQDPGMPMP